MAALPANEYIVHLAVPGFAQEELVVEIAGRFVTVRGDQTQTAIDDGPFRLGAHRAHCSALIVRNPPVEAV